MLRLHNSRLIAALIVACGWTLTHATPARGESVTTVVDVDAKFLFVPQGFDNNDQIQVVIDGFFPNACYSVATPAVGFDANQKLFTIKPRANLLEGPDVVCGTYEVPYTTTAVLGLLEPGTYTVEATGAGKKPLTVTRSSNRGPDDDLYARVDQVDVNVELNPRQITAHLSGHFSSTCMRWQEMKVLDQGETIVLLPIVQIEQRDNCQAADIAFKGVPVQLPWRGPGRYLLHTRGFNGLATNNVFTVEGE